MARCIAFDRLSSVQYIASPKKKAGLLGVYRHQTDIITERTLSGFFIDGYGTITQKMGEVEVLAEAEVAYLHGQTNRITNRNNPEGLDVRALDISFRNLCLEMSC